MKLFRKDPPAACPKCGKADGWRMLPIEMPQDYANQASAVNSFSSAPIRNTFSQNLTGAMGKRAASSAITATAADTKKRIEPVCESLQRPARSAVRIIISHPVSAERCFCRSVFKCPLFFSLKSQASTHSFSFHNLLPMYYRRAEYAYEHHHRSILFRSAHFRCVHH